ncbi:hypothetical protein J008_00298 [Cryptococcus neoformans]|uniref:Rab-GAP TBC domain-containing protein n=2 Tax=Cryptococcus neoformans TaxID=5207 RepID=A0A854QMB9_CRYNE|nr:hypothetical protein CNAG_00291 [Cryptococcus neoformans var. grubii H99]AUB21854.1 hypothetical protein CKF44_00291 [Cryptococcus neoformans var. grubii]OWT41927.1 hypothetical protein C362_00293 [Cryptococcus neoformans var. grubii Bt1]OWZ37011.1 hypothetical protein C347_00371 [Cryptococcus neoformans var. grubii AD2-60a]OWZ48842.1 hypothetical protein C343_00294 [Cryptococcus neoformans var. grubii C23]OWZ58775.1 hypothetical protein C368_00292 [Cryptococcus neoformans var. grubii 125.9|eukprot:XP_012046634.1 hypothetical protein CNAG_00291 [Cryptococcus neoformans var. grubii H99]
MSTILQDWIDLLNAEQHVQVDKLKEHARHGIAAPIRGEVWLYLLNVLSEDKTSEITSLISLDLSYKALSNSIPSHLASLLLKTALVHHTKRFRNETYADLITSITAEQPIVKETSWTSSRPSILGVPKSPGDITTSSLTSPQNSSERQISASKGPATLPPDPTSEEVESFNTLRSQLSRILPKPPSTPPSRHGFLSMLEEVLGKFWNAENLEGRDDEWRKDDAGGFEGSEKDWVYLCTPFVCCLSRPVGVFLGFKSLMERMRAFPPLPVRLASFLTLFRQALPELHSYCEDEQVPYVQVALSWMTTLLAKEMWLGDVLRLWDTYLAAHDMFALHCYVCVAIFSTCKETLEELDGSEAKLMLLDLPPMDVDRLLQDAANLRVTFPLPRQADEEE